MEHACQKVSVCAHISSDASEIVVSYLVWTMAPNMNVARVSHAASLLPNGKILVTGGYNGSASLRNADIYDPSTNTWTSVANMNSPRDSH